MANIWLIKSLIYNVCRSIVALFIILNCASMDNNIYINLYVMFVIFFVLAHVWKLSNNFKNPNCQERLIIHLYVINMSATNICKYEHDMTQVPYMCSKVVQEIKFY